MDEVDFAAPKAENNPAPVFVEVAGVENEKPVATVVVVVVFAPNPLNPPPGIKKNFFF